MEIDGSTKFSPSKLASFEDCPRRYRFRYVDRIKTDAQTVEAFLGTCAHAALEALYEGLQHGKTLGEEETLAVFERAWDAGWSEKIRIHDARYAPADWRALGRQCVSNYYRAAAPFAADRTVAVERRVSFPIEVDGASYMIEGYIDRLALGADGAFEIHDYKTGRALPTQDEVDADKQLAIYEIAVRRAWPDADEVRLVWHYLRHGKSLVSRRTEEARRALLEEIAELVRRIKREREFPPVKSALCDWCEYRPLCPLFKHAAELELLPPAERSREEGARLVDELAALAARKKELRERIKELERDEEALERAILAYAESRELGAVSGESAEAVVAVKEEWKLPTKTGAPEKHAALEAELKATPLWAEVSQLDAHRLLELYKRKALGPEGQALVEEILARYAKRVTARSLRLHRRRNEDEP